MKSIIALLFTCLLTVTMYAQTDKEKALQHFEGAKQAFHQNYTSQETWNQGMTKTQEELNKSLELDQSTPDVFYYQALLLINAEQFNEAIKYCDYAIAIDSTNAEYHLRKGVVYSSIAQYTAAIASLNQALVYDPQNPNIYFNRGMVYYFTDQLDVACTNFKKAQNLGLESAQQGIDRTCQ